MNGTPPFIAVLALKSALVCLAGIAMTLAQDREIAGNRYTALAGTLFMLALLPAAMVTMPPIGLAVLPGQPPPWLGHWSFSSPVTRHLALAATAAWLAISAVLVLRNISAARLALAMANRAQPVEGRLANMTTELARELGIEPPVNVRYCSESATPATVGWRRPIILLPRTARTWPFRQLRHALLHELGHIRRYDWPLSQFTQIVSALYWPILPVWWIRSRLERYSEIACDQLVVAEGADHLDYAYDLVRTCRSVRPSPALVAMSGAGQIGGRVITLIEGERYCIPVYRELAFIYIVFFALMLLVFAAVRPIARPPGPAVATGSSVRLLTLTDVARYHGPRRAGHIHREMVRKGSIPPPAIDHSPLPAIRSATFRVPISREELPRPTATTAAAKFVDSRAIVVAMPRYPLMAHITNGAVTVRYRIDAKGQVTDAVVARSRPPEIFDHAALEAVKTFRFRPASVNGIPVDGRPGAVVFRFTAGTDNPAQSVYTVTASLLMHPSSIPAGSSF